MTIFHRTPWLALLIVPVLSACSTTPSLCLFGCNSERRASTSLVEYLYPQGDVPAETATAELHLPLRVGLTFLPARGAAVADAALRQSLLERVQARFRSLDYVRDIVIVPDYYLAPRGGFDALQQLARLQDLDVIALVSSDQVSHRGENERALAYLTVVGAFLVRGSEHETHTLLDLAVVEPQSRSLLLRAGGTSSLADTSKAIEQGKELRRQQAQGLELAVEQLLLNLDRELQSFAHRVRAGEAPVRVVRQGGGGTSGGGGAADAAVLAALAVLALGRAVRRRPSHSPLNPRGARASRGR